MKLEIKIIGSQAALILPEELLARLGLGGGDSVLVTEGARSFTVAPFDPNHDEVMAIAHKAMVEYRETFEALAK